MNILYCGDHNILDGLIISIASLLHHTKEVLNIYVFTMRYEDENKTYIPLKEEEIQALDKWMKEYNPNHSIILIDITDIVNLCLPKANINTRFTPYCMLRLYADQVKDFPNKILYLDNDVVCLKDPSSFYHVDNQNYELVGVLDYYGSRFFKKKFYRKDYLNSGVLLLNLDLIRKNELFEKARKRCQNVKMLLPDQTALNLYSNHKYIMNRKYNEQKKSTKETVFRHFTTTFKFWPTIHTQTIKPWHIDALHNTLHVYELDEILEEYKQVLRRIKHD